MRYSDNHNLQLVHDIDNVVAECSKRELSYPLRERLSCERTLSKEVNGCLQILREPIAQTRSLLVEVGNGFTDLDFGGPEECRLRHFFRALRRANTSSAETASMLPALYSA